MRAARYTRGGVAADVLTVVEEPRPEPGPGEVRVRLAFSGVNPGDTKKRADWQGLGLPFPLVIPHSDGSGVVDAVGDGVAPSRLGQRVWVWGAQSYRAFGTAAEYVCVPDALAPELPDGATLEVGACLGIPGITAHRCVFADGPVAGKTVLVQGVLGGVGRLAALLARQGGAAVIGTVRKDADVAAAAEVADHVVVLGAGAEAAVRAIAPDGVDRIVEVAFGDNIAFDSDVVALDGVLAAYATRQAEPALPFWPLLFANVTIRLVGSDDLSVEARADAVRDLSALAVGLAVPHVVLPLDRVAEAHDRVDAGSRERVLLSV